MLKVTAQDIREGETGRDYVRRISWWRKALLFVIAVCSVLFAILIPAIAFTVSRMVSPLIPIACLSAVFVAGVVASARLEYRNAWAATFAYRVAVVAGYLAGMIAIGWAMYDLVIPQMDKIAAVTGDGWMLVAIVVVAAAAGVWGAVELRRHNYRQRSGKFLEPREP